MVIRAFHFNLYLSALLVMLACGCETGSNKKPMASINLHLEDTPDGTSLSKPVPIYRAHPVLINVETTPFLTEDDLKNARLLEVPGGFMLQLQFNDHGTLLLDQLATSNRGKHYAVYCIFGEKLKLTRWLAAPLLPQRVANGTLSFTPDADLDETKLIVTGLTNRIAKIQGQALVKDQ